MYRRIAILLVNLALVAAIHSDVLKCYMCTSLSNENCGSDMTASSLEPEECTGNKMVEWQRSHIQQHKVLSQIAQLFEVDDTLQHYQGTSQDMACAKMILNLGSDDIHKDVIIRTCQSAKTEAIDPCKTMDEKLKTNLFGKMEQCMLCHHDACNGMRALSPEISHILLLFLGTLIHVAFYHWA